MRLDIQLFADGSVEIDVKLNTKNFEVEIEQTEEYLQKLLKSYEKAMNPPKGMAKNEKALQDLRLEIEKTTNKLDGLRKKQMELGSTSGSNGMGGLLKSMSKWGLAIFSIRSAYMLIRQTASQLAQQNDEMAGKIEAIKGSITNALAPVVEVIVNYVYRLLSYLNVITKEFLGLDLFKKSAKSGKNAVGSAKQLRKTLAGFDEMNVLNDTSSAGGGGGGGSSSLTPPDTSAFQKAVQNFKKMWDEILEIDRKDAKKILLEGDKTWGLFKLGWFDVIQGIVKQFQGFVDIFSGIWDIIKGISEGNTDLIWKGVEKLIGGIAKALSGFVQTIWGIGEMVVGFAYGLITDLINGIKEKWQAVKDWFSTKIIEPLKEKWNGFKEGIANVFNSIKDKATSIFNSVKDFISDKIITPIKNKFNDLKTGITSIFNGIKTAVVNVLNKIIGGLNTLIKGANKVKFDVPSWVPGIGGKKFGFNIKEISTIKLAKGGIINQPGRGVPLAMGGEVGREGVIPLTDSQQMALLGEAIGRYITINANITNSMNGRIISRELQKIQNENNFAGNR